MNGFLLTIILDNDLFVVDFFRLFRIGFAWGDDEMSYHKGLILGVWKLETNIVLAYRKELKWQDKEVGQA